MVCIQLRFWASSCHAVNHSEAMLNKYSFKHKSLEFAGRMPRRATQVCAIVRTIPPFIDAYDSFVKSAADS